MTRHPVRKVFRDLLSLQGYPLPFESIERLVEADGAAERERGEGERPGAGSKATAEPNPEPCTWRSGWSRRTARWPRCAARWRCRRSADRGYRAASAALNVALGRIAAAIFAGSGR